MIGIKSGTHFMSKSPTVKHKCLHPPPALMDRDARRRLLFAPINVHHYGGKGHGGTTIMEKDSIQTRYDSDRAYGRRHTAGDFGED
jgi:hypothetical protein